jgi:hypothetical protein
LAGHGPDEVPAGAVLPLTKLIPPPLECQGCGGVQFMLHKELGHLAITVLPDCPHAVGSAGIALAPFAHDSLQDRINVLGELVRAHLSRLREELA